MLISRGLRIRKEKELKLEKNVEVAKGRVGILRRQKLAWEVIHGKRLEKAFGVRCLGEDLC